ncbi:MAG: SCO family protein [Pseudomonadota bacterium]
MKSRYQLTITLVLAVAAMAAGVAVQRGLDAPSATAALAAGTAIVPPRPLTPFSLQFGDAGVFDKSWLEGRHTLLFFGFANCPDICPTTLATLADTVERLRAAGSPEPAVVFVSVDPERDTPEAARDYARFFDASFHAATGDDPALKELTKPLGILFMDVPLGSGGYTVDHSTALLLIDPGARLAAVFSAPHDAETLARDLERVLAEA